MTIGLGLMLLSLHLLGETIRPIESSKVLKDLLAVIAPDPLILVLLSAAFAWLAHSSVAAMLFIMSLATAGVIDAHSALVMVLGANLGSSLNPLLEGTGGDPVKLRVPFGNLAMRVIGCARGAAADRSDPVSDGGASIRTRPVWRRISTRCSTSRSRPSSSCRCHGSRSCCSSSFPRGSGRRIPACRNISTRTRSIRRPSPCRMPPARSCAWSTRSIPCSAARRISSGEDDIGRVDQVSRTDDVLDRLFSAIRRYLSSINHEALSEGEAKRLSDILAFAINLEHVGDIIDKNLMELAAKRIKNHLRLPKDSLDDITSMHAKLLEHLQLAASVLMFQDIGSARRLVSEKERFRDLERAVTQKHLDQLRSGRAAGRHQHAPARHRARSQAHRGSHRLDRAFAARTERRTQAEPPDVLTWLSLVLQGVPVQGADRLAIHVADLLGEADIAPLVIREVAQVRDRPGSACGKTGRNQNFRRIQALSTPLRRRASSYLMTAYLVVCRGRPRPL